jgi:ABC-2 type transport system permease protein
VKATSEAPGLHADWVATCSAYNPFEWAVIAGRGAMQPAPDWATIWAHLGLLAVLAALMTWMATAAFRAYQRST